MKRRPVLVGDVFGKLTIIEVIEGSRERKAMVRCECGQEKTVRLAAMWKKVGPTVSCGCVSKSRARDLNRSHGGWGSSEYSSWQKMKSRCQNPRNDYYDYYGGRGITVCAEWAASFEIFLTDMGLKPSPKHSLDRIAVDGNYAPENCRWATSKEQSRNHRRNDNFLVNGMILCATDAAAAIGVSYKTLKRRLKYMSKEAAILAGDQYGYGVC